MNRKKLIFVTGSIISITIICIFALYAVRFVDEAKYTLAFSETSLICKLGKTEEDCSLAKLNSHGLGSYDPWGNLYLCEVSVDYFTVTSLGRNEGNPMRGEDGMISCKKRLVGIEVSRSNCDCMIK